MKIKALAWSNQEGDDHNLEIPLPFGQLLEDISNKTFYINSKIKYYSQLERLMLFIKNGWRNASSQLIIQPKKITLVSYVKFVMKI